MLSDVVRKSLAKVNNRFELVVLAAERCRQLMAGARPSVENPTRERLTKVALRELIEGRVQRDGEQWKIDRPPVPDIFIAPPPSDVKEILGLDEADEEE